MVLFCPITKENCCPYFSLFVKCCCVFSFDCCQFVIMFLYFSIFGFLFYFLVVFSSPLLLQLRLNAATADTACSCICWCVYMCVWCAPTQVSRRVLCKIKSTSAGSHSDKINRTWHILRCRQMLALLPSEHFPSPLSSIQITFHLSLRIFPPAVLTQPAHSKDLISP